jgi:asparagine synthase (glutamine-hydrolysing)
MCGIGGVLASGREPVDRGQLVAFTDLLAHRGPDGSGTWVSADGRVGLAHRRLAIIDPDVRSDQPMTSADGHVTVTYNGELYNHRELRSDLERRGHRFRTTSDTEVLVEALAQWGAAALPRLRGMFALAAHDARTGEVLLARDALGIKPLHHARTADGGLAFASEVRALRPLVPRVLDEAAVIDLLLWGSIAAPRTAIAGVASLPAGSLARWRDGRLTIETWASPPSWCTATTASSDEAAVIAAVRESVRAHLVADVPVAVFLSSGVDSGVIASIAAKAAPGVLTALTVRDPDADESVEAAALAHAVGIAHVVVDVALADAVAITEAGIAASDQPSVDGMNSFVIARAAADAGFRVALSGVGGDELFGGYPTMTRMPRLARAHRLMAPAQDLPMRLLQRPAGRGWDRGTSVGRARWVAAHVGRPHGPYLVVRGVFAPAEVAALLDADLTEVMAVADDRLATLDIGVDHDAYPSAAESAQYLRHQLLRDIDATSMASSVEVRTPLVDARLQTIASGLPQAERTRGPAKALLRAAAEHPLPGLGTSPKRGFSVPMGRWVRSGTLPLDGVQHSGVDASLARRTVADARSGRAHWSRAWLLHALGTYVDAGGGRG